MMRRVGQRGRKGFTFVELLVAAALTLLLVAIIFGLFTTYQKAVGHQEELVEIQQTARTASDRLREYVMQIGRGVRTDLGQPMVIYASPYEMYFNADIEPESPWCKGREFPVNASWQIQDGPSNAAIPNITYTPRQFHVDPSSLEGKTVGFGGNAETYRIFVHPNPSRPSDFTMDSVLDRAMLLQVNNKISSTTQDYYPDCSTDNPAGNTLGDEQELAYGVRWDNGGDAFAYPNGERQKPLFMYWGDWDFNPLTPDELWGDTSCDGKLDKDEIFSMLSTGFSYTTCDGTPAHTYAASYGAVMMNQRQCPGVDAPFVYNSEDLNCNGLMDEGEDLNKNRKLDRNLLDTQLHRIEVNITTIAKNKQKWQAAPSEGTIQTSVEPRNLNPTRRQTCATTPSASASNLAADLNCSMVTLTWDKSHDDGSGRNDVVYYKVMRRIQGSPSTVQWQPIGTVPAGEEGRSTYAFEDATIQQSPTTVNTTYNYQVFTYNCGGIADTAANAPTASAEIRSTTATSTAAGRAYGNNNYLLAYDTACVQPSSGNDGSVTLEFPSLSNIDTSLRETEYEYWIYRAKPFASAGDPGSPFSPVWDAAPIFKVTGRDRNSGTGCGNGDPSPLCTWEDHCGMGSCNVPQNQDTAIFTYLKLAPLPPNYTPSVTQWYVVRDEPSLDRAGEGSSLLPANGHQYGVAHDTATSGNSNATAFGLENRYVYKVEVHRITGSAADYQCVVGTLTQHSPSRDVDTFPKPANYNNTTWADGRPAGSTHENYMESQSFPSWNANVRETRFVPPFWGGQAWDINSQREGVTSAIQDWTYSVAGCGGTCFIPKYKLLFYPSKSERCSNLGAYPINEYWVVRERWIRDDAGGTTTPYGPDLRYSGQRVIFKVPGAPRVAYQAKVPYTFMDDPTFDASANWAYHNVFYSEDTCSCDGAGNGDTACTPTVRTIGGATRTWYRPKMGNATTETRCFEYDPAGSFVGSAKYPAGLNLASAHRDLRPLTSGTGWTWNPVTLFAADTTDTTSQLAEVRLTYQNYYKTATVHPLISPKSSSMHFEYYYYVVAAKKHVNPDNPPTASGDYYSIGVSAPHMAANVCAGVTRPTPTNPIFDQCDYLGSLGINLDFMGSWGAGSAGTVAVASRRCGSNDTWAEFFHPTAWSGLPRPDGTNVRIPHYECPGPTSDATCWIPSMCYEYQVTLAGAGGNVPASCPMSWTFGPAYPGTPDTPLVRVLNRDCENSEIHQNPYLRFQVKPQGLYCWTPLNGNTRGTITTLPQNLIFEIHKQWKYPWEKADPLAPDAIWKEDEDFVSTAGRNYHWKRGNSIGADTADADANLTVELDASNWYTIKDHYRFAVDGSSVYPVDRQIRYQAVVWADHNLNGTIDLPGNNCSYSSGPCDTGSGYALNTMTDPYPKVGDWERPCVPNTGIHNQSYWGDFSTLDFAFLGVPDTNKVMLWCTNVSNSGWPNWAIHGSFGVPGVQGWCNQPFTTDCWEGCDFHPNIPACGQPFSFSGGPGNVCQYLIVACRSGNVWQQIWATFNGWMAEGWQWLRSSHEWTYTYETTTGHYCKPQYDVNPSDTTVPPNPAGCLTSNNSWVGIAYQSIMNIFNDIFYGFASTNSAHFYVWNNWTGALPPLQATYPGAGGAWCQEPGAAAGTPRNSFDDFILAYHSKGYNGSRAFDSVISTTFLMQDHGGTGFFTEPTVYEAENDFGAKDYPTWWPWGSNDTNRFAQNLYYHGNYAVLGTWATCQSPGCCEPLGFSHSQCTSIAYYSQVPQTWPWGFHNISPYSGSYDGGARHDLDTDAHANMLMVCHEKNDTKTTHMFYMTMHDPHWIRLHDRQGEDIEQRVFHDAMQTADGSSCAQGNAYYPDNCPYWNAWEFNSHGHTITVDILGMHAFAAPLDEIENKIGRFGWWFGAFNWANFFSLQGTPTYGIDNVRIHQYCGECPPRFIEGLKVPPYMDHQIPPVAHAIRGLDDDYPAIFTSNMQNMANKSAASPPADTSQAMADLNLVAAGVKAPPKSPYAAFYRSGMTVRDISLAPLFLDPKTLKEDPNFINVVGMHPFYYRQGDDGRLENVLVVTEESLKKQLGWSDARIASFRLSLQLLDKAGLLPLTPAKVRFMMSTGRLPGR